MRELSTAAVLDEGAIVYRMQPVLTAKLRRAELPRAKRLGPPRVAAPAAATVEVTTRFVIRSEHSQPALLVEARFEALRLERVEAAVRAQAVEVLTVQALPCAGLYLYLVEIARAPFCTSRRNAIATGVTRYFGGANAALGVQPEAASSSATR
jgi:hypothetical protein